MQLPSSKMMLRDSSCVLKFKTINLDQNRGLYSGKYSTWLKHRLFTTKGHNTQSTSKHNIDKRSMILPPAVLKRECNSGLSSTQQDLIILVELKLTQESMPQNYYHSPSDKPAAPCLSATNLSRRGKYTTNSGTFTTP